MKMIFYDEESKKDLIDYIKDLTDKIVFKNRYGYKITKKALHELQNAVNDLHNKLHE